MPTAKAFLGNGDVGYHFKFNPDSVDWGFTENVKAQDTLGGRVIQVLSAAVDSCTVTGQAGKREDLLKLSDAVREVMRWHINHQRPVHFKVPSRGWDMLVYVQVLERPGWDLRTVSYPYRIVMGVDEDLGVTTQKILGNEISRLAKEIGFDTKWSGGNLRAGLDFVSKAHESVFGSGSNAGTEEPPPGGNGGGHQGGDTGPGGTPRGDFWRIESTTPIPGNSIKEKIKAVFGREGSQVAEQAIRVAQCESGLNPKEKGHNSNGTTDWGLFQINDVHEATYGKYGTTQDLLDEDFNIKVAYKVYRQWGGWGSWVCQP